jgi:hypothetical protein
MICVLVACALMIGSQTLCDKTQPQRVQYVKDPAVIATQHECDEVFKILEHILPEHGVSMRRREWYAEPKEPKDE